MAATPAIDTSQAGAMVVAPAPATAGARASLLGAMAVYNFPSEAERVSHAGAMVTADRDSQKMRVSLAGVMVVGRGRIDNLKVRAWGFPLDAHRFYLLRLGETETVAFDLETREPSNWCGPEMDVLPAHIGGAWRGLGMATAKGGATSNVIAGDDSSGMLWKVRPDLGADDRPSGATGQAFRRVVTGGASLRGRDTVRAGAVTLASDPAFVGATSGVTLRVSDDQGVSWLDCGTVDTALSGGTGETVEWRGLGLMRAPGRLFEISDYGALTRVNGLELR